ncbi:MAG: site-2 protease family protein [Methanosarcinales archaeon]|nr:site-2 protease family protein [ANME-2 cluster archaeon]MDF1531575.1 site-2 protease family protein [ANME-2 cluster archaeon]MDW7776313.1 site-2 protease family protein [Methanosarcinales archaeon]
MNKPDRSHPDSAENNTSEIDMLEFIRSEVPDFKIYEYSYENGAYFISGTPKNDPKDVIRHLWAPLSIMGYGVQMVYELGEHILIVAPIEEKPERIGLNVVLAVITVFTTMFFGSMFFGVDPFSHPEQIIRGAPFTLAIMFVLGSHEMGHYIVAKLHGMKTSLPYFIPFIGIGTMGAIIKHRGPIPSRTALFDVGIAGPIVGLVASIIVTAIGLSLPPVDIVMQDGFLYYKLSLPLLFSFIASFVGGMSNEMNIHPVAFAGWVGMLVTALNLIPAGQLDGGHIMRAMLGPRAAYISAVVPFVLLSLSLFIYFVMQQNGSMWLFWGLFISLFAVAGHPEPLEDSDYLGRSRMVLGTLVFLAGLLCITLIPIQV